MLTSVHKGCLSDLHGFVTLQMSADNWVFTMVDIGIILGLVYLLREQGRHRLVNSRSDLRTFHQVYKSLWMRETSLHYVCEPYILTLYIFAGMTATFLEPRALVHQTTDCWVVRQKMWDVKEKGAATPEAGWCLWNQVINRGCESRDEGRDISRPEAEERRRLQDHEEQATRSRVCGSLDVGRL